MSCVVFAGPTLSAADGRRLLDAEFLPPVAQGDVYRVACGRPWGIGIIDGYFERMPSVWHKEILWAMKQGVHVFGAASMGALRAAELELFGMRGVGEVYEAFRNGELTDDDEVAVHHGPEETGYRALSEAMVDVRATLRRARDEAGLLSAATARALVDLAKRLHYGDRDYATLLQLGAERGLPEAELAALRSWLPHGRVLQKHADAVNMLRAMKAHRRRHPRPMKVRYRFNYTEAFDQMCRNEGRRRYGLERPEESLELLLDELRLRGQAEFLAILDGACARALALEAANWHGIDASGDQVERTARQFRLEQQLHRPEQLQQWLAQRGLEVAEFVEMMRREARVRWVRTTHQARIHEQLEDHLVLSGRLDGGRERAADKARRLAAAGYLNPAVADTGLGRRALVEWHFSSRGGGEPPDLDAYAQALGLESASGLLQLIAREFLYRKLIGGDS